MTGEMGGPTEAPGISAHQVHARDKRTVSKDRLIMISIEWLGFSVPLGISNHQ